MQALEHRAQHQHLLLVALVDLARGDLAAVALSHHEEKIGVEGLLDAALRLGDVGRQVADVDAHVIDRAQRLARRIVDIGDAARQRARRLVAQRRRPHQRRLVHLLDGLHLVALLDLQALRVAQRHPARAGAVGVGAGDVPPWGKARELVIARDAQQEALA